MKSKIFDKKIFFEGLHQLKGPTLISFIIVAAASVIFPVIFNENSNNIILSNVFLLAIIYLIAPILTIYLFNFLFKRKACDFYHSLAPKRITLYVSFSASIAACIIVTAVFCSLLTLVSNAVFNADFSSFRLAIPIMLNIIAGSLLMVSGMLIGCAISGRYIAAIASAVIILFFPRIFISAVKYAILYDVYILDENHFCTVLDNKYNVIIGGLTNGYTDYEPVIYTLILAVIYFIIGAYLFNKRKSEIAGVASLGKVSQVVFRVIFSLLFCLPVIIGEVEGSNIVIFYFFAVVAYFLFEIITKQSFRNLLRPTLELAYVVILNLALVFGIYAAETCILSYQPNTEDIESVRIVTSYDGNISNGTSSLDDSYNLKLASNVEIKNAKVREALANSLKLSIKYSSETKYFDYEAYQKDLGFDNVEYIEDKFTIAFKSGLTTKYRKINISESDYNIICNELENNTDFNAAIKSFPDKFDKLSIYISDEKLEGNFNEKDCNELYQTAKKEFLFKSFNQILKNYYNNIYENYQYGMIQAEYDNKTYCIPITSENMPETMEKLFYLQQKQKGFNESLNSFVNQMARDNDFYLGIYDLTDKVYDLNSSNMYSDFANYIKTEGLKYHADGTVLKLNDYDYDNFGHCDNILVSIDKKAFKKYLMTNYITEED